MQLRNTVLDLKRNVRVFFCVRQIIPSDNVPPRKVAHVKFSSDAAKEIENLMVAGRNSNAFGRGNGKNHGR